MTSLQHFNLLSLFFSGYQAGRWDSSSSLGHNDSFDGTTAAMTSSPSASRRPPKDNPDTRPPIPEKRNTSHSDGHENYRVTLRSDSHKGKVRLVSTISSN